MTEDLIIGIVAIAIGLVLVVIGLPRGGASPRFLQFEAAMVLYPPVIMIFLVLGAAKVLGVLF
jgi:hypothetical protein